MAEWSKAPDSMITLHIRVFWSTNVGVGSNPTSDNYFWLKKAIYFIVLIDIKVLQLAIKFKSMIFDLSLQRRTFTDK